MTNKAPITREQLEQILIKILNEVIYPTSCEKVTDYAIEQVLGPADATGEGQEAAKGETAFVVGDVVKIKDEGTKATVIEVGDGECLLRQDYDRKIRVRFDLLTKIRGETQDKYPGYRAWKTPTRKSFNPAWRCLKDPDDKYFHRATAANVWYEGGEASAREYVVELTGPDRDAAIERFIAWQKGQEAAKGETYKPAEDAKRIPPEAGRSDGSNAGQGKPSMERGPSAPEQHREVPSSSSAGVSAPAPTREFNPLNAASNVSAPKLDLSAMPSTPAELEAVACVTPLSSSKAERIRERLDRFDREGANVPVQLVPDIRKILDEPDPNPVPLGPTAREKLNTIATKLWNHSPRGTLVEDLADEMLHILASEQPDAEVERPTELSYDLLTRERDAAHDEVAKIREMNASLNRSLDALRTDLAEMTKDRDAWKKLAEHWVSQARTEEQKYATLEPLARKLAETAINQYAEELPVRVIAQQAKGILSFLNPRSLETVAQEHAAALALVDAIAGTGNGDLAAACKKERALREEMRKMEEKK